MGNPQLINFIALEFDEMLTKIVMGEYIATKPWWLEQQMTSNKRHMHQNQQGGKRPRPDPPNNDNKIYLQEWDQGAKLCPNEAFHLIFHVSNKVGATPPLSNTGVPLCHRF